MITVTVTVFVIALCLGLIGVPIAKKRAIAAGLVDHPDQQRKLHKSAIPLIGGIVVFLATLSAIVIVSLVYPQRLSFLTLFDREMSGLLIACFVILVVGIIDDRFMIRGRQKLLGQIVAASVLIFFGYRFDVITVFGQRLELELQIVSIVVAYGWILLAINSVNLLDGADGFATTIGILTCLALSTMAYHKGHYGNTIICAAAAGSLVAFMRYNFPPASAYLGDAGSMLIGLFISAMAIKSSSKEATAYTFLAPIALLAIPMFDTLAAIVRRRLTGRSIYTVDRGHLHHVLIGKGFGPRKALLLFFAMCLMTATGGTMSLIYRQAEYAIFSIMAVGVFLVVGRVFGFAEFKLISNRSRSVFRSFFTIPKVAGKNVHHASIRLQGSRNWDLCWQILREFAEQHRLLRMTMDLNLPWIHESFHANYSNTDRKGQSDEKWSLDLPLVVRGRLIGRIALDANVHDTDFGEAIVELNNILVSLESYFIETIEDSLGTQGVEESLAERQSIEFGGVKPETKAADVG